uniref:NAC domain-containing protein n=1 Tax=Brassica campestris TaxID=3711 RepID=M4CK41_BRACM
MNGDQSKSKVDESSSKSNYVLGREEGSSSSSHTRVNNNLREQQRLMMLRSPGMPRPHPAFNQHVNHMYNLEEHQRRMLHYHRMPHTDHPSSSSIDTVKARVYPPGSRFLPTNLGCLRVHLRNKVDKKKSGSITTLDLYEDDPWLLDHVQNDLFPRGEWYYFTPRNKRGATSCTRTVRGREGGTWKTTSGKEPIKDKNNKVEGYVQSLVYNKTDVNGDIKPTGWNMKEYCLYEENQDDLVLCRLKGNLEKKGFAEEVKNNILSKQVQEEQEAGANRVDEMRTLEEDHGEATQQKQEQDAPRVLVPSLPPPPPPPPPPHEATDHGEATQQQQHQDAPPVPVLEGQDSGMETMMMMMSQYNGNNFMTMLKEDHGEATQQQQPQEQDAPPVLVPPPLHESHELGFETMITMRQDDHGDATQKQKQEQDAPQVRARPSWFWTPNNDNNFMPVLDENQQYQFDDLDLCFESIKNDANEAHLQPVSHAQDAVGGSSD